MISRTILIKIQKAMMDLYQKGLNFGNVLDILFCSYTKLSKNLELEEDRWCLMSEDPSSEDKPESVPTLQRTTF